MHKVIADYALKAWYRLSHCMGMTLSGGSLQSASKQTLYVTAREGLYWVRMLAKGMDRMGK